MDIFSKVGLNRNYFDMLALSTKFIERVRKLSGADYFQILIMNAANAVMSYNSMASTLFCDDNKSVYKQAIHKAFLKPGFEVFFDELFREIFNLKVFNGVSGKRTYFKRILIQDSTILNIPKRLLGSFSGVSNGAVQVANCRMQLAVDIVSNVFTYFSLDPYSHNDLLAAPKLLLKKGDLVLRDRGYFKIADLYRIAKSKAYFISRFYNGVKYYDLQGEEIDIAKELRRKNRTRMEVRIGNRENDPVILWAVKVNEEFANERRRKAKANAMKKRIHAKTLILFSWHIYLTNIEDNQFTMEDISNLYSLRWRIEIIFKALKSHCNLDSLHKVPERQMKFIIKSRILLVLLITTSIYRPINAALENAKKGVRISLLQLVNFMVKNIYLLESIMERTIGSKANLEDPVIRNICKYCQYSKRENPNYYEKLEKSLS